MATLQQVLLLGTDRVSGAPPAPHAALTSAWSGLDWTGAPETALLEAAAIVGVAGIAGTRPGPTVPATSPSPEDEKPEANNAAVNVLKQLLEPEFRPLLVEWLEVCKHSQRRAPAFLLPRLLAAATLAEREALSAVAGERGRWLSAQNPGWHWLVVQQSESTPAEWETGTELQRLNALRSLRKRDPAAARALIEKTWSEDPPEFREKAIDELGISLSAADELFLEKCLRDRRREVRTEAQRLLCLIPGSGFSQRMSERAGQVLVFKKGLLSKKLEVVLSATFAPEWKIDGIEEKPTAGMGEKAFWARQILECVPLRHWAESFRLSLESLVELAVSSEWADLLLGAWFRSLRAAPDAEAAVALFEPALTHPKCFPVGMSLAQVVVALLEPCPPETRWALAEKQAANAQVLWAFLPQLLGSPKEGQARAVLRGLAPALRDGFAPGGSPHAVEAARRLPLWVRDEADKLLQRDTGLTKTGETFLRALELRARCLAAFNTP